VRGPYEYTTAIILKMNSGDGTVKFSMAMEMFVRIKPIQREGRYVHGNLGAWSLLLVDVERGGEIHYRNWETLRGSLVYPKCAGA